MGRRMPSSFSRLLTFMSNESSCLSRPDDCLHGCARQLCFVLPDLHQPLPVGGRGPHTELPSYTGCRIYLHSKFSRPLIQVFMQRHTPNRTMHSDRPSSDPTLRHREHPEKLLQHRSHPPSKRLEQSWVGKKSGLRSHTNLRPKAAPAHTATNPTITLREIFNGPVMAWPSWTARSVSYSNVENVVYDPINPMGIR
jgi:hypothetical protein